MAKNAHAELEASTPMHEAGQGPVQQGGMGQFNPPGGLSKLAPDGVTRLAPPRKPARTPFPYKVFNL